MKIGCFECIFFILASIRLGLITIPNLYCEADKLMRIEKQAVKNCYYSLTTIGNRNRQCENLVCLLYFEKKTRPTWCKQ